MCVNFQGLRRKKKFGLNNRIEGRKGARDEEKQVKRKYANKREARGNEEVRSYGRQRKKNSEK